MHWVERLAALPAAPLDAFVHLLSGGVFMVLFLQQGSS